MRECELSDRIDTILTFGSFEGIGVAWVRKLEGLNVFPEKHTKAFSNRMNVMCLDTVRMWDSCESVL